MESKDISLIKEKLSELKLTENLKTEDLEKFYSKVIPVLKKYDYQIDIEPFYNFIRALKILDVEIINFIRENPQVITKKGFDEFIQKYIFLSVIENETNSRRIKHMKKSPKDFKIPLDKLYSKYYYLKDMGIEIDWNTLLRNKQEKLDKKVMGCGGTPLTIEKIKEMYPVNEEYINELKLLAINNFGEKHEKGRTR